MRAGRRPRRWYGTPGTPGTPGAGQGGGGHDAYPPVTPAPTPKAKPNRGIGQLTAVAILAAALASGGTYAATRAASPVAPAAATTSSTTQGSGSTAPQVVQGSATAPDWTATAKAVAPSVVSITVTGRTGEGQGSGVVIDAKGHILTNNHVATGAGTGATISVSLNDGRTYDATIVGTDPSTDLAVLQLSNPPSRPHADRHRRLVGPHGGPAGHGRRQPAGALRHRHHRHRQRPEPAGHDARRPRASRARTPRPRPTPS